MQIVRTLGVVTLAVLHLSQAPARSDPVLVTSVVQGDAIRVQVFGSVRLLGIDAPRAGRGLAAGEPFGRQAQERLATIVGHRWVRLEFEPGRRAEVGRHAAYVLLEDGTFVNAVLVREGLARVTGRGASPRATELGQAEDEARTARRGIWSRLDPDVLSRYRPASAFNSVVRWATARSDVSFESRSCIRQ